MGSTFTTNASLPVAIDESRLVEDVQNLYDNYNTAMATLEKVLTGAQPVAVNALNASVINVGGKPSVLLQMVGAGSISTIIGQITGRPFTLIFQSGTSIGIPDAGLFKLASAFIPSAMDTITLIWDGSAFYEVSRSVN